MNVVENAIIKELSQKYGKKEETIKIMLEKSINLGYNINSSIKNISAFIEEKILDVDKVNDLSTVHKIW